MSEHITIAFHLAWLVGVWHMLVAGWLIFGNAENCWSLNLIALSKGTLGALIYVLVRDPPWATIGMLEGILLPIALLMLLIFSVQITWVIIQVYELKNPFDVFRR